MIESDLLDPYEKLIAIDVLGHRVEVPENNRLLRCFQFLSIDSISYGDFCWNGECTHCQFWYHEPGQTEASDKTALSCRFTACEGLVITRLSQFVELEGINKQAALLPDEERTPAMNDGRLTSDACTVDD